MATATQHPVRKFPVAVSLCLLLGAGLAAGKNARADDWPQFRRDAERTAAAKDPVQLPLTEVWTTIRGASYITPGSTSSKTVVWNGAVYYVGYTISPQNGLPARTRICADARTGSPRWSYPLAAYIPEAAGDQGQVAVSSSGLVYFYNTVPWRLARAAGMRNAGSPVPLDYVSVEVVQAENGAFVGRYLPRGFLHDYQVPHDSATRLFLIDRPPYVLADTETDRLDVYRNLRNELASAPNILSEQDVALAPSDWFVPKGNVSGNFGVLPPTIESFSGFGTMLLRGQEMLATSTWDHLFEWTLGSPAQSMRVIHPMPQHTNLDWVPVTGFGGYPPTSMGRAVIVGSDYSNRFLAAVEPTAGGRRYAWWHRDWPHSLGIATVSNNLIFVGAGGPNADEGVYALDSSSGATRWSYAPTGFRTELPAGEQFVEWWLWDYAPVRIVDEDTGKPSVQWQKRMLDVGRQSAPMWRWPAAFLRNPGVVTVGERVFAAAGGRVAALDQRTGKAEWTWAIPPGLRVASLAASEKHLFVVLDAPEKKIGPTGAVCALNQEDGSELWNTLLPKTAEPALSRGLLFLSDREILRGFAPAERIFRLAVDSPRAEDYLSPAASSPVPASGLLSPSAPNAAASQGSPPAVPPAPPGRADATVLRLKWGTPLPALLEQVRKRREVAPRQPLLISLDWLNPRREQPLASVLTANGMAEFAQACGQLAAAGRPAWFDVAPELNIYLARNPAQQEAVLALVRTAGAAIHSAYGPAKVVATCNLEVLTSKYGMTDYQPFGKVPRVLKQPEELLPALGTVVDALGISSYPQCAYARPENVPGDHFLALKDALAKDVPGKPLLVTQLLVWRNLKLGDAAARQASFVRRALRACYWLDAPLVAYPEALEEPKMMGASLRAVASKDGKLPSGDPELEWREVLAWKRVEKLTVQTRPFDQPLLGQPNETAGVAEAATSGNPPGTVISPRDSVPR